MGIGDTLVTFKANQLAIFTNEGPNYFFFFDQNIGRKKVSFLKGTCVVEGEK